MEFVLRDTQNRPRFIGSGGFARGFLLSSFRVAFDPSFSQRCIPRGSASRFESSFARLSDAFRCKDHPRVEAVDVVATSFVAPLRGGKVSRKKFEERFQRFHEGRWTELLAESVANAQKTHQTSVRRRHRQRDDGRQRQLHRALRLVHVGELSAARQVLESADVAPGTLATLRELTNPARRPPVPRQGLSKQLRHSEPRESFQLDAEEFLSCLRTARRGAAPGPSGLSWRASQIRNCWSKWFPSWLVEMFLRR